MGYLRRLFALMTICTVEQYSTAGAHLRTVPLGTNQVTPEKHTYSPLRRVWLYSSTVVWLGSVCHLLIRHSAKRCFSCLTRLAFSPAMVASAVHSSVGCFCILTEVMGWGFLRLGFLHRESWMFNCLSQLSYDKLELFFFFSVNAILTPLTRHHPFKVYLKNRPVDGF